MKFAFSNPQIVESHFENTKLSFVTALIFLITAVAGLLYLWIQNDKSNSKQGKVILELKAKHIAILLFLIIGIALLMAFVSPYIFHPPAYFSP